MPTGFGRVFRKTIGQGLLHCHAVHDPIQGRRDLVKKYDGKRAQLPPDERPFVLQGNPDSKSSASLTGDQLDEMIHQEAYAEYRVLPNRMVKVKQRQDNPQFAAMVESIDESLGRVVDKLKTLGLAQNTIIIFTSDNGGMAAANFGNPSRVVDPAKLDAAYSTSNLPLRGAKGWLYEGGIRVPLIIRWPGKGRAGAVINEPVTGTDYYPTILDMVGVSRMPGQHPDGESLAPLFEGEAHLNRDAVYWHFPHYSNHGMQSPGGAIRSGDFKLLEYFENGTVQLFNLKNDIGEHNDLARAMPEKTQELRTMLHDWANLYGRIGCRPIRNTFRRKSENRRSSEPTLVDCSDDDLPAAVQHRRINAFCRGRVGTQLAMTTCSSMTRISRATGAVPRTG